MINRFEKLSKEELVEVLESIFDLLKTTRNAPNTEKYRDPFYYVSDASKNKPLKTLIGTIPFLLMDEKIFEKNQDIAAFAEKLDIRIPWPDKKKKEDIIGRIIISISKFDSRRISELNRIITRITLRQQYTNKNSFFEDWDNAIKNMKL